MVVYRSSGLAYVPPVTRLVSRVTGNRGRGRGLARY